MGRFGLRKPSRRMMSLKRSTAIAWALVGAALASGCGSAVATHPTTGRQATAPAAAAPAAAAPAAAARAAAATSSSTASAPAAFAWLHPAPAPTAWRLVRLSGTAALSYPPSWQRVHSDPGTASAALVASGLITEYLNVTPQQANETLANWISFRPAHNRDEGDSEDQVLAAARGLRFRNGRGSCVIDRYRTSRTRYTEIACLVRAPAGESVIVAAGLTARWAHEAPALERAVSAFLA